MFNRYVNLQPLWPVSDVGVAQEGLQAVPHSVTAPTLMASACLVQEEMPEYQCQWPECDCRVLCPPDEDDRRQ